MPFELPTAKKPPLGLKAIECTRLRGDLDVGQFEKVVIVAVCTILKASFLVLDAMAKICKQADELNVSQIVPMAFIVVE